MKITAILFVLAFGLFVSSRANAQTPIVFAKGASGKTLSVTIAPKNIKTFSIYVKEGQVINFQASGDIKISKTEAFPVIGFTLSNGVEDVDQSQDGEAYISILAGRSGKFVISVNNSDRKRARTFSMKVTVTNNKEDYLGGDEVQ